MSGKTIIEDRKDSVEEDYNEELEKGGKKLKDDEATRKRQDEVKLRLDTGKERVRFRRRWFQLWLPKNPPPPPPASLSEAPVIPLSAASILSILSYAWVTPIMTLGFQRTLQATDLWKMDTDQQAGPLSVQLDEAWDRRVNAASEWNAKLAKGEINPSLFTRAKWSLQSLRHATTYSERRATLEKQWREVDGLKEPSLVWALNDVFGRSFWLGGLFKVFGDTAQLMGPILVKAVINFGKEHHAARTTGTPTPSIGRGVGMAIGLFLITVAASVAQHQFFWRSMTTGLLARAALISSIYKRGVYLTGKARTNFPSSALMNHISTDVSRVDSCAQWFHATWTAPIQVTVCLIILLIQLGPSALAGFSLFILMIPLQERVMAFQFQIRKKANIWTDQRAKIILEVLGAMRVVKYFSYEIPFLNRIFELRKQELFGIRQIQFARSANLAFAFSIPVLAATLSFVTYTATSHEFDVAIIFASFSLFQLLRQPLIFLPRALSATTDAQNAMIRLTKVFHAPLYKGEPFEMNPDQKFAVEVREATFEWEEGSSAREARESKEKKGGGKGKRAAKETEKEEVVKDATPPFQVADIDLLIPRGSLVAVVGSVGSGKSSLLQGLIGEMRKVKGSVSMCGRVAYCPQTAWIQNATLRDNVIFGQPLEEDRYWKAVENSCLLPDLQVLADGDLTEIGEKGINLSGGQKQRVNIARALYHNADIVIFDDPLSAVDAHVGKALFADAIIGALHNQGKTVILVTHALHFLSQCDYVYTLKNGRIAEQGSYDDLVSHQGEFARLIEEFGGKAEKEEEDEEEAIEAAPETPGNVALEDAKQKAVDAIKSGTGTGKLEGRLIRAERRTTGSVGWRIYSAYIQASEGFWTMPVLIISMILMQASQILNSYTLVWWQANTFHKPNSTYQVLYACFGISQAVFTFAVGLVMDAMGYLVSQNLHHNSITNIFYSPMSFFDTTPTGRILSVFGKDIDNIDNQLPVSMRLLVITIANVIGAILIITILEHYFLIAAVGILLGYQYFAAFYRESAREIKRLDAILRSVLYAHFAESLSGLPTIRSYGETQRFLDDNEYYIDLEDRANYIVVTNQRWLAIRLDFLGGLMTFVVAMLAVTGVNGIDAAQIGLVLTYTTSLTQQTGMLTRQSAEVENYMQSVETLVQYSRGDLTEQEAPHELPERKPAPEWPAKGALDFKDVVMRYRPGLPFVLKGLSMYINGGEKIGVVGRTGAGKSSLMLALFRIVELSSGSISIDGVDISTIGLRDLRSKIAIIPQDPLLFSGTVRSNLDPFNSYDDARLWDALRRSYLVEPTAAKEASNSLDLGSGSTTPTSRFNLDTVIESDGANLSVGERSLLSLARALVKDSKVVVLDEATASVDLETDAKIQQTIQTQFHDKTLLCIAHRLRTIISYDRILVMDAGNIAEFDTPLNLFMKHDGLFRGMCERSNISIDDIQKASLKNL
ncbi:ABC protein [Cristinia sonorae]|uniref:ABC protein n=1 Tax=Cristinia sonorae TaxID=1940300 RepID=A0A8K0ULU7_9AGAR|nr:ABC protein [Cristinia sonorae]